MEYRVLDQVSDFEEAFALEVAIWGLEPRDAVPVNMLRALQHSGGGLLGAYDGQRLVGIALGFPARSDHGWILWSHMTGIDRTYQGQGIGLDLKLYQRQWALDNGFEEMRWTFDPLQRGNANFNMHRLGATANQYHINFYGIMADEINHANVPSDRIEAVWDLRNPELEKRLHTLVDEPEPKRPFLLRDQNIPISESLDPAQPEYLAQIPRSLSNPIGLLIWRIALRDALTKAFAQGYRAVDFTSNNAYLLRRS